VLPRHQSGCGTTNIGDGRADDRPAARLPNERLVPDLSRGRGKSIGEDLDIDDEGSEQNFEPLQSLHHRSVGYQSVQHELTSPRRLFPTSAIENTSKNKKERN
jgi:hypothetical protein